MAGLLLNSFLCNFPPLDSSLERDSECNACLFKCGSWMHRLSLLGICWARLCLHHRAATEDEGPPWNITHWFAHSFDVAPRKRPSRDETLMISVAAPPHRNSKLGGYTSCRCFALFLQHISVGRVSSAVQVFLFDAAPVFPGTKLPNYPRRAAEPLSRRPCWQVRIPAWKRGGGTSGENNCQRCPACRCRTN